jgi:glycosyltransferase involved in cell wall biosynthesis
MSIAEAMAAGCPVVATRTMPWADIERTRAGFWVEQHPQAIANALAALLDDPAEAHRMGVRGRQFVAEQFGGPAIARAMLRVYEQALARPLPR